MRTTVRRRSPLTLGRLRRIASELAATLVDVSAQLMLCVTALLILVAAIPLALGWRSDVVITGSMSPRVRPGDVVLSQPVSASQVAIGQVVLVEDPARPGELLMHRLVRREPDGSLITQGDVNAVADSTPVPVDRVLGLPRLRIPYVGLPVVWRHIGDYSDLAMTVILTAFLYILHQLFNPQTVPKHRRPGPMSASSSSSGGSYAAQTRLRPPNRRVRAGRRGARHGRHRVAGLVRRVQLDGSDPDQQLDGRQRVDRQ